MSKRLFSFAASAAMTVALAGFAAAQDTKTTTTTTTQTTKTIQNADGSYTVIEYPADKEVTVNLTPGTTMMTSKGLARVMRHGDATTIKLDLSGLPADMAGVNLYTVDPAGALTLLGPVTVANGVATQEFTTPLDKFMLVLSPNASLSSLAAADDVIFRSAVPEGVAVVPTTQSGPQDGAAVGERVAATAAPAMPTTVASPYSVPLLGIPNFRRGTDTHLRVNFPEFNDARANIFLEPRSDGPTTIKLRFHSLTRVPAEKRIVLWAVAADGTYTRLGQVVNTRNRNEAQIQTETALKDFGLLITLEDTDSTPKPSGPIFATVLMDNGK